MALENTTNTAEIADNTEIGTKQQETKVINDSSKSNGLVKYALRLLKNGGTHQRLFDVYREYQDAYDVKELKQALAASIKEYGGKNGPLAQEIINYRPYNKLEINRSWLESQNFSD
tara:strand:- start:554 stop:901 length:348 start_codon:yes stop_codon:yes gene_type:complete